MFNIGDLVIIIRSDGLGPVDAPPALVINIYEGIPNDVETVDLNLVYDLFFMGVIEKRIDGRWISRLV